MNLFLDCEFNQFEGGLISLALVTEDGAREFYEVIDCKEELAEWVAENVMPILGKPAIPYVDFQTKLRRFLKQFARVNVIADYPDDIARLCKAVITGPGEWFMVQPMTFEIDDALSAKGSKIPHNALEDARALRLSWLKNNGLEE